MATISKRRPVRGVSATLARGRALPRFGWLLLRIELNGSRGKPDGPVRAYL